MSILKRMRTDYMRGEDALKAIFDPVRIKQTWKDTVWKQMREFPIQDVFDYYDFHFNIKERAKDVRTTILDGDYQITRPLIYKLEKTSGICRHMVQPTPIDALVLQVLIDEVSGKVLEKQPSDKAYYSRDKHSKPRVEGSRSHDYLFMWWHLWRDMQKEILKFSKTKRFIVETDIVNYYDSLDLTQLRSTISGYAQVEEVVMDLIMQIIDEVSWRPNYLPHSGKGLPTIHIEGVRLLAFSFLFWIDKILDKETGDNFTRWMDDITFGADDEEECTRVLHRISEELNSRGLGLNISKTKIMSAGDGYNHFEFEKNETLDNLENRITKGYDLESAQSELESFFEEHLESEKRKNWDKVMKRVIKLFGRLKSDYPNGCIVSLFVKYPSLREYITEYFLSLGYSKGNSGVLLKLLNVTPRYDDLTLFDMVSLTTQWEIPTNDSGADEFLHRLDEFLKKNYRLKRSYYDFYCYLWTRLKYNSPDEIFEFIKTNEYIWSQSPFLRRQVVGGLARSYLFHSDEVESFFSKLLYSGDQNVSSIVSQVSIFSHVESFPSDRQLYFFPSHKQRIYPLGKFIVLTSVLNSKVRKNKDFLKRSNKAISDPYYLKWISQQSEI